MTDTKYCAIITSLLFLCAFPLYQEGRPAGLGAMSFSLRTLQEPLAPSQEAEGELYSTSGFCTHRQRDCYALSGGIRWRFLFLEGNFPTLQAGMTEVYLWIYRDGLAGFSCSRSFFAQTPEGFEDISKSKGEQRMKYRAVWKPGGRPRRGMGSMKPSRKQLQALKPRGAVFRKLANKKSSEKMTGRYGNRKARQIDRPQWAV